jgi:hypothetical protein
MSAFFIVFILWTLFIEKEPNLPYILFMGTLVLYFIIKGLNKRPETILNLKFIWAKNFEDEIQWQNVIAIYFKTLDTGESKTYSYMLHYYDERYDYFKEIEFSTTGYDKSNIELTEAIIYFSL